MIAAVGATPSLGVGAQTAAPAAVELVSFDPLRVRGERFKTFERVRLTVRIDGRTSVARVRAGRRGAFVASLPGSGGQRGCTVRVVAVGGRGSHATLAVDHFVC